MRLPLAALIVVSLVSSIRGEADPLSGDDMKHFAPDAVQLGWKYFQKGDYETALRRFQMAIRHDADFAPAYFGAA
jgi:Tfp pilus assembly protein PilF